MKFEWKQIIVAFVLGLALGAFGIVRCLPFGFHGMWKNPEKFQQHMMQQFTSRLNLDADQQQKISDILNQTRAKMDALRQETHPKFEQIREAAKEQIRVLLTPEQQQKFEAMNAEMDARFKKHHPEPHGNPGEA